MTIGSDFSNPTFDPKAYVNDLLSAYASSHDDEKAIEQYMLDAEMRVHVKADALSSEMTSLREQVTAEFPRAARQLTQIKEEVGLLHMNIEYAMRSLSTPGATGEDVGGRRRGALGTASTSGSAGVSAGVSAVSSASQVFSELQKLQNHRDLAVKAKNMLEEASNLSSLFKTIDSMLQSDDLMRLADSLARFRKGLEIISLADRQGDGSKSSGGSVASSSVIQRNKVDQLEERVFDLAVRTLDNSLRLQNGEHCRRACVVLNQIDRAGLIAQHYCTIRGQPLMELWESYRDGSGAPYASWVGTFYEEVARAIRGEMSWCGTYLDGIEGVERRMLVIEMLVAFFGRVEVPCKARLAGATRGGLSGIEAMEQVIGCTGRFVDTLCGMLLEDRDVDGGGGGEPDVNAWSARVDDLIRVVIRPYDDMLRNYVGKEEIWLSETVETLFREKGQAGTAGYSVTVVDDVFASVMGSLQRCEATTQYTSLPEVLDVVDGLLAAFCERLSGGISAHYSSRGASSDLGGLLAVPRLTEKIRRVLLGELTVQIREKLDALQANVAAFRQLEQLGGDSSRFSGAALLNYRRVATNSELSRAIERLGASPKDGRRVLPKLRLALERANREMESLIVRTYVGVMDVHFAELQKSLEASHGAAMASPTSSAYPSQYMISAGEQLMLLPQLLESSLDADDATEPGDEGDLVGQWLERLGEVTCSAYLDQLAGISKLDASQCHQLCADVEYLCKIVNSLDCEVPVRLMAWAALLTAGDEEGALALVNSLGETPEAQEVARKVVAIRFR